MLSIAMFYHSYNDCITDNDLIRLLIMYCGVCLVMVGEGWGEGSGGGVRKWVFSEYLHCVQLHKDTPSICEHLVSIYNLDLTLHDQFLSSSSSTSHQV